MSEPLYPCTQCKRTGKQNCKKCLKWRIWFGHEWQKIRAASGKTGRKGEGHG